MHRVAWDTGGLRFDAGKTKSGNDEFMQGGRTKVMGVQGEAGNLCLSDRNPSLL
jgi:hypothetical protein